MKKTEKVFLVFMCLFITVAYGSITLVDIPDNWIFPRIDRATGFPPIVDQATGDLSDSVAPIPITYTIAGTPDSIMALVLKKSDHSDTIVNWTKIAASPGAGTFTDTLKYVVHNNFQYVVEIKEMPLENIDRGGNGWGVGMVISPCITQSHATAYLCDSTEYQMINSGISFKFVNNIWYPFTANWQSESQSSGDSISSVFASLIDSVYSGMNRKVLIGIAGYAAGGRGLHGTDIAVDWHATNSTVFNLWLSNISGTAIEILVSFQGEHDAGDAGTTAQNWIDDYKDIVESWIPDSIGYKPRAFIMSICTWPNIAGSVVGGVAKIHYAQTQTPEDTSIFYGASTYDLPLMRVNTEYQVNHLSSTSLKVAGYRCARTICKYLNGTIDDGYRFRILSDTVHRPMDLELTLEYPNGETAGTLFKQPFIIKNKQRFVSVQSISGVNPITLHLSDLCIKQTPLVWEYARSDYDNPDSIMMTDLKTPLEPHGEWDTATIAATVYAKVDTIRYWLGSASADPADPDNWSDTSGGSAVLAAPDSTVHCVWDENGDNACAFSAAVTKFRSITVDSAYTASFSTNSKTTQLNGSFLFYGKALTLNGPLNILYDGDLLFGAYTTVSVTGCNVKHYGSGIWDHIRAQSQGSNLNSMKCSYPGKTIWKRLAYGSNSGGKKLELSGGRFIVGSKFLSTTYLPTTGMGYYLIPSTTDSCLYGSDSSTICLRGDFKITAVPTSTKTYNIEKIKFVSFDVTNTTTLPSVQIDNFTNNSVTFNFSSKFDFPWRANLEIGAGNNTGVTKFNFTSDTISCKQLTYSHPAIGGSVICNWGNAVVNATGGGAQISITKGTRTGAWIDSFKTSTWNLWNDIYKYGGNTTDAGGVFNIIGYANSVFADSGNRVDSVCINKDDGIICILQGLLSANKLSCLNGVVTVNDSVYVQNFYKYNGDSVFIAANVPINMTGNMYYGSGSILSWDTGARLRFSGGGIHYLYTYGVGHSFPRIVWTPNQGNRVIFRNAP